MSELARRILQTLRYGGLNGYVLAAELGEPPAVIRDELKRLRRRRLVIETLTLGKHEWRLSHAGMEAACSTDQLHLAPEVRSVHR